MGEGLYNGVAMHGNFNDLKNENMKGTEFWKHNYPDIVGVQVDEEGNIIEKVDLGVLLEAYHQAKLKLLGIADVVECKHDFEPYYNWCSELTGYRCEKCGEEKD